MDQQMKQELLHRFRERECTHATGGAHPNHPADATPVDIARWIIDIIADAQHLAAVEGKVVRAPKTYDPKDVEVVKVGEPGPEGGT